MEILVIVAAVLAAATCFDPLQRRRAILRNIAIVGHCRYLLAWPLEVTFHGRGGRRPLSPFQIR